MIIKKKKKKGEIKTVIKVEDRTHKVVIDGHFYSSIKCCYYKLTDVSIKLSMKVHKLKTCTLMGIIKCSVRICFSPTPRTTILGNETLMKAEV